MIRVKDILEVLNKISNGRCLKSPVDFSTRKNSFVVTKSSDIHSRLDIKATTNNKEHINIEIQVKNEYNMVKRSMYYWSKMYEGQIIEGYDYDKLERSVCINILDFKCLKNDRFMECLIKLFFENL